jgi:hypothetical protein
MARTRYRRSNDAAKSITPPSPDFVAGRAERLAGYVAGGVLTANDVAVVTGIGRQPGDRQSGEFEYVGGLRGIGLTVVEFTRKAATVVCPHCGGKRRVTQGTVADRWVKKKRVPACNAYGNRSCEPSEGPNA